MKVNRKVTESLYHYTIHVSSSTPPELGDPYFYLIPALAGGANDLQPLPGLVFRDDVYSSNRRLLCQVVFFSLQFIFFGNKAIFN